MARRKSDSEAPEADAPQDDEAAAKAEVEERIEDGDEVRDAIAAVDGYDGEQGVYLGPKPLVDARVAQAEAAEAEVSRSSMMRKFHERRRLGAVEVESRRDVNERPQAPAERVHRVELDEPADIAHAQPVTGGKQGMPTHRTGRQAAV